ncbi:MORC family CW-type zinc finger protein 4 [Oxyura jamaicensis]|uniref:MORC family CW-type zinc finger protein 4 n=1 Tax=Oxyura jamaicensis TaxID=8884 RepID=UPI0015A59E0D|nr:MORC family CW-type zinc finger protein 4 [Oxyura jamaicensis]
MSPCRGKEEVTASSRRPAWEPPSCRTVAPRGGCHLVACGGPWGSGAMAGPARRYLQGCGASHAGPFSAVAELLDNASDPSVAAKLLCIDVVKLKGHLCLTFTDNGAGLTPHKLHHMLSFGFTEKAEKRDHPTSGLNGNGFQSGSMRLGKDAVVFTKNGGALSVGLFSQTYLERVHAEAVIVPLVPFNQQNKKIIVTEDSLLSLKAILEHTLFSTREELLAQFDDIPGKKGTRVLIWNIHRNKDGKPELDFDTDEHDIRLADFLADSAQIPRRKGLRCQERVPELPVPEMEYSLRAYCSILYLKPCVQIILRQKKVNAQLITKSLANTEYDLYKPRSSSERVKITFGFSCKNKNHYGIMMYHKNRLIRSYEKVGCQKKGEGVGVIGVIECNFLKPTHNKQDFEESKEYRQMISVLGQKLNNYWKAKIQQMNLGNTDAAHIIVDRPDQIWVQCEECLKWRKLPDRTDLTSFPEKWFCHLHPLHKYRSCLVPEELEQSDGNSPSYRQKCRKREQSGEKKRRSSLSEESVEQQVSPPASVSLPAKASSFTCTGKVEPEEKDVHGTDAFSLPCKKMTAVQGEDGPREQDNYLTAGKPKLTKKEEIPEKSENIVVVSPPDLTSPSPHSSSLQKSFVLPYQERENLLCRKQEDVNVGGSLHACVLEEQLGTSFTISVSRWERFCLAALPSSSAEDKKTTGVIQGGQKEKMPKLKARRWPADMSVCVNACRSTKDVDNKPFVPVVTVLNAATSGGAPIQLYPFGWKQRLHRSKVEEAPHLSDGDRGGKDLQVLSTQEQEGITEQADVRRAVENLSVELKNISAGRDLLHCKVEETEREKCCLNTELMKSQQELAMLRPQKVEGLYWSKKYMGYCQAELQELKAKLAKSMEEKAELMERLKDTEMHLEVLREAQVSRRGPEKDDVKSVMEKLKNLRVNVGWLLSLIFPHLELRDTDLESDRLDEILKTVLEANRMQE